MCVSVDVDVFGCVEERESRRERACAQEMGREGERARVCVRLRARE